MSLFKKSRDFFLLFFIQLSLITAFSSSSWAITARCIREEVQSALSSNKEINDRVAKELTPQISEYGTRVMAGKEPIKIPPVDNQGPTEDCWAHSECGMAETEFIQSHPGLTSRVSTEHQQFYHLYSQIKNHLGYFEERAKKISQIRDPKKRAQALKEAVDEAYSLAKSRTGTSKPDVGWIADVGNDEGLAFKEAAKFGMVPEIRFPGRKNAKNEESSFEAGIKHFILENMYDPKKLKAFHGVNPEDGLNDALFDSLSGRLRRYYAADRSLGQVRVPFRPNQTFKYYNGKTYTPISYMREYLGFQPEGWVALKATRETHQLALQAMAEAMLRTGKPTFLGMTILTTRFRERI